METKLLEIIRKAITFENDSWYCQACEQNVKQMSCEIETLLFHYHSESHLISLSQKFNNQLIQKNPKIEENSNTPLTETKPIILFDLEIAQNCENKKDLKSFFNECISGLETMFKNQSQQIITY